MKKMTEENARAALAGAGLSLPEGLNVLAGAAQAASRPDLAVAHGASPEKIGRAAIDAEIQRLKPLMDEGGYIPHTDHSCPPDISFENYTYYMKRLKEVCQDI